MPRSVAGPEIERVIKLLSRLPGLGPRSARKAALALLKRRDDLLAPLAAALTEATERIATCPSCGNLDTLSPCSICRDPARDPSILVVVEEVADLWALERAEVTRARYHVLGGHLSPLDGIGPDALNVPRLIERVTAGGIEEVILALNATVEGQSTMHYVRQLLLPAGVVVSEIQKGVPMGGELDYLDDGTLAAAIRSRRRV
ncbi:MAG: recombination mediator RecR [Hyphomicrobiaceae bacterium]|nr:recombination mediator RecR [Hyphomicrobiaceae bacterium]